jgi:hypothetical protein
MVTTMKDRAIKIIKKNDRGQSKELPAEQTPQKAKASKRQATRETIATITGWVRDIKERQRMESRRAFDSLFSNPLPDGGKP